VTWQDSFATNDADLAASARLTCQFCQSGRPGSNRHGQLGSGSRLAHRVTAALKSTVSHVNRSPSSRLSAPSMARLWHDVKGCGYVGGYIRGHAVRVAKGPSDRQVREALSMVVEPVLLLNHGTHLSLARVTAPGQLEAAVLPYELPVSDRTAGRFFDADGLVIDRHPTGLRLTPAAAEPALPSPPGESGRSTQVLRGGRGAVVERDHVLLFDAGQWTRHEAPDGVQPYSVVHLGRWWAGGARGTRPVLFDPTTGVEETLRWKRRWWSPRVSDGTFVRVEAARSGLVVNQDDGMLERSVTRVYLRANDRWSTVYVGDDLTSRVSDPDGVLPPVLLNSGRWIVPTPDSDARVLSASAIGDDLRKAAGQRDVIWRWVGAASGLVTALLSLWPSGEHVLLRGDVGGELDEIARWAGTEVRPTSAALTDTSTFSWRPI